MDFEWIAIASSDVAWITIAFVLGFIARLIGLPPLVGFLTTGFLLNSQGFSGGEMLGKLSDLGITLLLFIVGLKLNIKTLIRPQVWAVTTLHTTIVITLITAAIYSLALTTMPSITGLSLQQSLLIAFALSFSSTVFVVKVLEENGQMASLHGRIAVGILIMQDLAAVIFLAASMGKWPTYWALSLLLLIPFRPLIHSLLHRVGHGELLVLYGFLLAMGGAEAFELVGLKGDLGALILGVLIASHPKADEMSKAMLGFKDLFLLGFFLSIGLSGPLTVQSVIIGALLVPFIMVKSALFFGLLTGFKLRARTALITSFNLTNYSEFGLIVIAIGVSNGWIGTEWLIIMAVALSFSFVIAAGLSKVADDCYAKYRQTWLKLQRNQRLNEENIINFESARILVIGMGGIGTGAYDKMRDLYGDSVTGIDIDPITVANQVSEGRKVLVGDPSDYDFWDRIQASHTIQLVMLALPKLATNYAVLEELNAVSFTGKVAATVKFQDEIEPLHKAGIATVFNIYSEAGAGFAAHVIASDLIENDPESN